MRRAGRTMLALLALLALPATAGAQSLGQAVAAAEAAGFSGQVAAADRTTILFNRTTPGRTAPTRWIWGSVSKQVTAALAMTEVQSGRLSLDDTVRRWLPEFANAETGTATVRDLLRHTSGIADPAGAASNEEAPPFYTRTGRGVGGTGDALGVCAGPAAGARGAFRYNNCDTIVLSAILERTSGRAFADLLRTRIAAPFRLRSVRLARSGERPVSGAHPRINVATLGAAGALIGTAEDLLRFDQALLGGRLLGAESLAVMWQGEPRLGYVALGAWEFRAPLRGCSGPVRLVERRGSVAGVQARNIIAPELGRAVVAFTADADYDFGEIWRGAGFSYELASAAFCQPAAPSQAPLRN